MDKLILRIKKGDERAFESFVDLNLNKVFNFCYSLLESVEDSEEVCQDVFLKFWAIRKQINLDSSPYALLFRIAKNLALNRIRDNQKHMGSLEINESMVSLNTTMETIILKDMEDIIRKAINTLPPKRRTVFMLSRYEGLSNKEIAAKLNISVNTVESQMSKAIKTIHAYANTVSV
ncbi:MULTISPECIES: RNA polymerase sigma-70 factor [Roseivirga]|jgi:RNA polymerase sigma-70 factor (ECF subfamily)|uniref:RNA polymerase sigma-70 factor n=1 Tax=Roseivirga thermotolerans TaxID=1758176 RepID=A0ABQ3IAR5_9BACT|nr:MULTISPECIES: RNA polymerase sigma-70 factor [Roseivirga]MEC7755932.1 RNA polymerase sigma-70 factor [Bacteroidota bacterium]GHE69615.1 RNA polymerase sigma-70 factor [Roseivirga thermotolerans]|tara:strand:+ start:4681 stop:5208 length:528 start_codon:yes stop_codon:yes gene_type:complete